MEFMTRLIKRKKEKTPSSSESLSNEEEESTGPEEQSQTQTHQAEETVTGTNRGVQVSVDSQFMWGRDNPHDSSEDRDKEYVGVAALPDHVIRKMAKKGFKFTVMAVGESGLGKTTLLNSLFLMDLNKGRKVPSAAECVEQTVQIVEHDVNIVEKGVNVKLRVVDTPGFGDAIDNRNSWKMVEEYIDRQFEQYFRDESGFSRKNIQDNTVHCCLYFISPYGRGLQPLDVECMRALHEKVNIIPVVAKADSLTQEEVRRRKNQIREEIQRYGIKIYSFPECDSEDEEDFKNQTQILKDNIPFAVIGSNVEVESDGRRFRGRVYPWGAVEVENPAYSDFLLLKNMLVKTHTLDLIEETKETHYENYRAQCIRNMAHRSVQERTHDLLELCQESFQADFPLQPTVTDTERERLISERDEELRRMQEVLERIQGQMRLIEAKSADSPSPLCRLDTSEGENQRRPTFATGSPNSSVASSQEAKTAKPC